jgi:hypothetical protein
VLVGAAQTKAQAIDLAADVATLFDWLRRDILSLAELLTGQQRPHWLEMLGYQRFSRN